MSLNSLTRKKKHLDELGIEPRTFRIQDPPESLQEEGMLSERSTN